MLLLEQLAKRESFEAGDYITSKGKLNAKEYIVLDGICRTCIFGSEGEDNTLSFFIPGSVLPPYVIRVKEELSVLNIQAATDAEVISLDARKFAELMVDNLEIREFGNIVLRRELAQMFQKEIALASLSAKDRLIQFRQDFPGLENRIPHGQIASYLGITTISLSRLRKELMG